MMAFRRIVAEQQHLMQQFYHIVQNVVRNYQFLLAQVQVDKQLSLLNRKLYPILNEPVLKLPAIRMILRLIVLLILPNFLHLNNLRHHVQQNFIQLDILRKHCILLVQAVEGLVIDYMLKHRKIGHFTGLVI